MKSKTALNSTVHHLSSGHLYFLLTVKRSTDMFCKFPSESVNSVRQSKKNLYIDANSTLQ